MKRWLVLALFFFVSAAWSETLHDGPYMLIYTAHYPESNFIFASGTSTSSFCINGYNCGETHAQTAIEYFPTIEEALKRMNQHGMHTFWGEVDGQQGIEAWNPQPEISHEDLIGLFKVERIPLHIADSGKTTKAVVDVKKVQNVEVQEWKVK